ncbi:hypothetical protein GC209_08395 [bacterium]|nr:hypothetical protein [bacterium]
MPLQNRVLPDQAIVADPARGLFTGNRGILHDGTRTLRRRWASKAWICCALHWKDTRRIPMTPGTWTELFFLDEAVALSAGHRPCATCRRSAYSAFRAAWTRADLPGLKATEIDATLHAARLTEARQPRGHAAEATTLPDATFILHAAASGQPVTPHLLHGAHAFPFTPAGYLAPVPRPEGEVLVLTPRPSVAVLRAGYRPVLHPSLSSHPV